MPLPVLTNLRPLGGGVSWTHFLLHVNELKLIDTTQGTKLDSTIEQWADCFADNHIQFSSPSEGGSGSNTEPASDAEFPDIYHKLIHSSALETLLQLEHTYAMAVADVCKGWENAKKVLQERYVPQVIRP